MKAKQSTAEERAAKNKKQQVGYCMGVTFGMDPELFLEDEKSNIIGAEKSIPKKGLSGPVPTYGTNFNRIVLDGVQLEIHSNPHSCRQSLTREVRNVLMTLQAHLKQKSPNLRACFKQVVEVKRKELNSLSENARVLGCQPSLNIYDAAAGIRVNPLTYRKRSAGGHIHLSLGGLEKRRPELIPNFIRTLDIWVGNTFVMIDRDPLTRIRRRVYGRAGEYRVQPHGLEYRTLGNIWMRSPVLLSGAFGLARQAVQVAYQAHSNFTTPWPAEECLLDYVDVGQVRKAINTNDSDLAKKNWEGIRKFICEHIIDSGVQGFNSYNVKAFDYFISKIDSDGLEFWFPNPPMVEWATTDLNGWESFLTHTVPAVMSSGVGPIPKTPQEQVAILNRIVTTYVEALPPSTATPATVQVAGIPQAGVGL